VIVLTTGSFTPFLAKALLKAFRNASGENELFASGDRIKTSLCTLVLLSSIFEVAGLATFAFDLG
jgi:hypothetical protein